MASSTLALTEEEKNFIRFSILNFKVSPTVVRAFFDTIFPPTTLAQTLNHNMKTIKDLITKRRITSVQEVILRNIPATVWPKGNPAITHGTTAPTCSSDFDLTLMICLIRNIGTVNPPSSGWDKLPSIYDKSDGAHLARLKFYRNGLAHSTDSTMSNTDFKDKWSCIEEALTHLNGHKPLQEVTNILSLHLDGQNDTLLTELDNLKQKYRDCEVEMEQLRSEFDHYKTGNLPRNIAVNMEKLLEKWQSDDRTYYETSSYELFIKEVSTNGHVTVTGSPGSGKSALVRHAALHFMNNAQYSIIQVEYPDQILLYNTDKKQLFIVDDVLGKYSMNPDTLDKWERNEEKLQQCLKSINTIILCTLRSQVANTSNFQKIHSFLNKNVFDLCEESQLLSKNEKREIFMQHFNNSDFSKDVKKNVSDQDIAEVCKTNFMFPLLCRLVTSDSKRFDAKLDYFRHPFKEFKIELDKLSCDNKAVYCALVLCMLFNGKIETADIQSKDNKIKELINAIVEGCNLTEMNISSKNILDNLEHAIGSYVIKNGDEFKFIHDRLFESVSAHFAENNARLMLHVCNFEFIRDRVRIESKLPNDDESVVLIDLSNADIISKRMFHQLEMGNFSDVLLSSVVRNADVVEELCKLISKKHFSYYDFLQKLGKSSEGLITKIKNYIKSEKMQNLDLNQSAITHVMRSLKYRSKFINWLVAFQCDNLLKLLWNGINESQKRKLLGRDLYFPLSKPLFPLSILAGNKAIVELFLSYADINCYSEIGATPLSIAIMTKRLDIVEILVQNGAFVNKVEMFGQSFPLIKSVQADHLESIDFLVKSNVDFFSCDIFGNTFMSEILLTKSSHILQNLLGSDINGMSELLKAILNNEEEGVKVLRDNPNLDCFVRLNQIQVAAALGLTNIVKVLLSQNMKREIDISPLHIAVINNNIELAESCIQYESFSVNEVDLFGRSPFHYVQSVEMASLLIKSPRNLKNVDGIRIQDCENQECGSCNEQSFWAIFRNTYSNILFLFNFGFVTQQLVAPMNIRDRSGNTALHHIVKNGTTGDKNHIIKTLVENGGNKYIRNGQGQYPHDMMDEKDQLDSLPKPSDTYIRSERIITGVSSVFFFVMFCLLCFVSFWLNLKREVYLPSKQQECLVKGITPCTSDKCNKTITELTIFQNNSTSKMFDTFIPILMFTIFYVFKFRSICFVRNLGIQFITYFTFLQILKVLSYIVFILSVVYTQEYSADSDFLSFMQFMFIYLFFVDFKNFSILRSPSYDCFWKYIVLVTTFCFYIVLLIVAFTQLNQIDISTNQWELSLNCTKLEIDGNVSTSLCSTNDNGTIMILETLTGYSVPEYFTHKNISTVCKGDLSEETIFKNNIIYFVLSSLCAFISMSFYFYCVKTTVFLFISTWFMTEVRVPENDVTSIKWVLKSVLKFDMIFITIFDCFILYATYSVIMFSMNSF